MNTPQQPARRQWLLLAPALLASLGVRAQGYGYGHNRNRDHDRDEGFFHVVRATYGTERRNVDVTERVRDLVSQDQPFRVSNNNFGIDPAPRSTKTLWIEAQNPRGELRTFAYREGGSVDGAQFRGFGQEHRPRGRARGWEQIEQATFGYERRSMDVTQRVRQLMAQGQRFRVDPQTMGGDPAYGETKYLEIRLRGRGGRALSFKEGSWIEPQQVLEGYRR